MDIPKFHEIHSPEDLALARASFDQLVKRLGLQ